MKHNFKSAHSLYHEQWLKRHFNLLKFIDQNGPIYGLKQLQKSIFPYFVAQAEGFDYLYRGFADDWYVPHEFLEEIFEFIDYHIKNGKVLVHCARGVSRSGGIIVAWLLKEHDNWTWDKAVEYVSKSRLIYPAVEIKESILEYFESIENRRRE